MLRLWVQTGDEDYVLCLSERRWGAGLQARLTTKGTIIPAAPSRPWLGVIAPDSMQRPMSPDRYGPSRRAVERKAWRW